MCPRDRDVDEVLLFAHPGSTDDEIHAAENIITSMPAIIDAHAHWYADDCLADLAQHCPTMELAPAPHGARVVRWNGAVVTHIPSRADDLDDRLARMDALGIGVQILSLGALDVGWAGAHAHDVARRVNETLAAVCRTQPGRLRFLATVPLEPRAAMVSALDRALGSGAVGVAVTTTVGGQPLDSPQYRDFWHEASRLALAVYVHPCYPPTAPAGDLGSFLLAGFPGETTIAAARLIYSGVLEEYPNTPIIWSHLGGALPMLMARLDAGTVRFPTCPQPASVYLKRCYYDTVCAHAPAYECARTSFGADHLLFGTDEPHRLDQPGDILSTLQTMPWSEDEKQAILSGTAMRLFAGLT
jgi:aminocarboxymuconate-semialdehyde decarboxylase